MMCESELIKYWRLRVLNPCGAPRQKPLVKTIGDFLGRYASCLLRIGERRLIALSRKSKRGGQFHKPLVNHAQRLNFRRRTSLDSRFVLPADSWIASVIQGTCQISRDWQLPGAAHDETAHNGDTQTNTVSPSR
jgi:hypothetical protein